MLRYYGIFQGNVSQGKQPGTDCLEIAVGCVAPASTDQSPKPDDQRVDEHRKNGVRDRFRQFLAAEAEADNKPE